VQRPTKNLLSFFKRRGHQLNRLVQGACDGYPADPARALQAIVIAATYGSDAADQPHAEVIMIKIAASRLMLNAASRRGAAS
jgi:hypothetical protein